MTSILKKNSLIYEEKFSHGTSIKDFYYKIHYQWTTAPNLCLIDNLMAKAEQIKAEIWKVYFFIGFFCELLCMDNGGMASRVENNKVVGEKIKEEGEGER